MRYFLCSAETLFWVFPLNAITHILMRPKSVACLFFNDAFIHSNKKSGTSLCLVKNNLDRRPPTSACGSAATLSNDCHVVLKKMFVTIYFIFFVINYVLANLVEFDKLYPLQRISQLNAFDIAYNTSAQLISRINHRWQRQNPASIRIFLTNFFRSVLIKSSSLYAESLSITRQRLMIDASAVYIYIFSRRPSPLKTRVYTHVIPRKDVSSIMAQHLDKQDPHVTRA